MCGLKTDYLHSEIRVFGIYTLAQMDNSRLWPSIAAQSSRKGQGYVQRCKHREIPKTRVPAVVCVPPAVFCVSDFEGKGDLLSAESIMVEYESIEVG
jgi:hypothetical protein